MSSLFSRYQLPPQLKYYLEKFTPYVLGALVGCLLTLVFTQTNLFKSRAQIRSETKMHEYSVYLKEVLRSLRLVRSVHMMAFELPGSVLRYQPGQRTISSDPLPRLRARTRTIPVVAISRGARRFLRQMQVIYLEPTAIPSSLLPRRLTSVSSQTLANYVLVPDLSGKKCNRFRLGW